MSPGAGPTVLRARDNPLLQRVRKLLDEPGASRKLSLAWLEGEHLVEACLRRGHRLAVALRAEDALADPALAALAAQAARDLALDARLMRELSGLESPPRLAALVELPAAGAPQPGLDTVVLDRLQDPGNVGSILRSAAALGMGQVLALKGTVALWSPKVLRAAQGAHFGLRLHELQDMDAVAALGLPRLATSSHGGELLGEARLPAQAAWVFGHEGRGVAPELLAVCERRLRIPQPGGEESLNVAAAAAICLYEQRRQHPR